MINFRTVGPRILLSYSSLSDQLAYECVITTTIKSGFCFCFCFCFFFFHVLLNLLAFTLVSSYLCLCSLADHKFRHSCWENSDCFFQNMWECQSVTDWKTQERIYSSSISRTLSKLWNKLSQFDGEIYLQQHKDNKRKQKRLMTPQPTSRTKESPPGEINAF